jgi:hypothetical protein
LLSLFEVILRNALNEEITAHFSDPDWLTNQRTGFMSDPRLTYYDRRAGRTRLNGFFKNSVTKSIDDLGHAVTHGKIIADLKFGFWTAFFDNKVFGILTGCPIRIFNRLPPLTNRRIINSKLNEIREFRNSVYHNEPIIFSRNSAGNIIFDLTKANKIYKDIREIFKWLDLDYDRWTKRINNITFELERAECMMKHYPQKQYYFNRIYLGIKHYKNKYSKF